jgi:hypothetical protein
MSEENKVSEAYDKLITKQARQQLKLQCLEAAIRNAPIETNADDIVAKAKAFYAFART